MQEWTRVGCGFVGELRQQRTKAVIIAETSIKRKPKEGMESRMMLSFGGQGGRIRVIGLGGAKVDES